MDDLEIALANEHAKLLLRLASEHTDAAAHAVLTDAAMKLEGLAGQSLPPEWFDAEGEPLPEYRFVDASEIPQVPGAF